MPYSYQKNEKKIAKAYGKEVNVSWKHCNEICYFLKGKNVDKAIQILEKVIAKEMYLPFRRYTKGIGHREKGQIGRYPVKASGVIIKLLENAKANAEFKDLDTKKLKIEHASAYHAITLDRTKPKGKAKTMNIELTNIEIILKEV